MSISKYSSLWHRRLGHYYNKNLDKYLELHDIKIPECMDCKIVKMKRLPHNKEPPTAKDILETIHSDIMGPVRESITGKRFILSMIDEKSRKGWLFTLKKKSEAPDIIINFLKYLNNRSNKFKIKNFKTDGANEYKSKKVTEFCNQNGIFKSVSPPYNPENNGVTERFNQTIVSSAKTLLYWSKLSQNFWYFAILYANYIYNKMPHSGIDNKIPDEIFSNEKSKINHIRVFGCICYYKDFTQHKGKFEPNAKKGIFLGFSLKSNSYIIMDYNDFSIHNVREIECMEDTPANISLSNNQQVW